jgi:hypothetical protein
MRTHRQLRQYFGCLAGATTLLLVLCSLPENAIAQTTQARQQAIDAAQERARLREYFRASNPSLTDAEIDAMIRKVKQDFEQRSDAKVSPAEEPVTLERPEPHVSVEPRGNKYSPLESVVPTDRGLDPLAPNTVQWKLLAGIAIGVVLIVTLWVSRSSRS